MLDFDDCSDTLGGHPSSPILPALLALAEERGASGRDVLTAYVAGFEVETCLGRGVNFHHYEKGWHPTSTLGVFGASAACAHLMRLDAGRTAHALSLCASLAAGVKSNLGSMAKPMHIGHASRSGLLAARLAAEGFTGNPEAMEHPHGFLDLFNGAGHYSIDQILNKWGSPWDIEFPGIAVKQFLCCLSTQAAIDVMLDLSKTHDLVPARVAGVRARISARRLEHTDRPAPRSALESKLSAQYVLACALADREVGLRHFEGTAYLENDFRALMERIAVVPLDDETLRTQGDFHADIEVTLSDGRRVSGNITRPVGHSPGVPLDQASHYAKYLDCVLTQSQHDALYHAVQDIGACSDIRDLMKCVA